MSPSFGVTSLPFLVSFSLGSGLVFVDWAPFRRRHRQLGVVVFFFTQLRVVCFAVTDVAVAFVFVPGWGANVFFHNYNFRFGFGRCLSRVRSKAFAAKIFRNGCLLQRWDF